MITKKTVLILGAGASTPYGFPSGAKLVEEICSGFSDNKTTMELVYSCFELKKFSEYVDKFIEDLSLSGRQSIDIFLMNRPDYMDIGKIAIASALIPFESQSNLFSGGKTKWYPYLFSNLGIDFEEFGKNELSIITYNYDRSLEFYIKMALEKSYGKSESESIEQLKKIPIIHMHGSLGYLPGMGDGKYTRRYEKVLNNSTLSVCENTIKVIHEDIDDQDQFRQANKLIKEAEIICFLGFGYDETNLDRLSLEYSDLTGKMIFGTAFEIGKAKRYWLKGYFDRVSVVFGNRNETIDKFLDDHPIIVRPEYRKGNS